MFIYSRNLMYTVVYTGDTSASFCLISPRPVRSWRADPSFSKQKKHDVDGRSFVFNAVAGISRRWRSVFLLFSH